MAEETFADRLWREVDEAFEPYEIPNVFAENLKKDLKNAFRIRGKARPGYEPGAVGRVGINLIDAVTNPLETAAKTFSAFTGELSRPPIPLAWTDAEGDVWKKLFTTEWVDAQGYGVLPRSVEDAVLRWNEGARVRATRLIREEMGIRRSPGLTLMMAKQLSRVGVTHIDGVGITTITAEAQATERAIARRLIDADSALRAGDRTGAEVLWGEATKIQGGKLKFDPQSGNLDPNGVDWTETTTFKNREKVRKEFERQSRLGSRAGAPQAAYDLANSPEAQFWRSWKNRRLYFRTLNFLNTFRKEGFWGGVREYAWNEAVRRIFGLAPKEGASRLARLRYYGYPANALNWVVGKVAEKVRLTALLTKLTEWRQRLANYWKQKIKDRIRKALGWIKKKIFDKAIKWLLTQANRLLTKLGLRAVMAKIGALIGGAVGTVAPGIGNVIAAVGGAVISFIGGIIAEKIWKPVLGMAVYLFAGACGCVVFALGSLIILATLVVGSIFAPGAGGGPGPGPGPPPPPPVALVTVEKKSCVDHPTMGWICQHPRTIRNTELPKDIRWEATVTNGSGQEATVTIRDEACWAQVGEKTWTLVDKEQRVLRCDVTYPDNPDLYNTTVYNTVTGTVTIVGSGSRELYAVGVLVIGNPPDAPPCGYPAGTAMSITSPFMATDVCRRYDYWCGTSPMAGCSVGSVSDVTGLHSGLDLNGNFDGQPLYSTINGTVMHISSSGSGWAYITVCNSNWCILYGHTFRSFPVSVGNTVTVGQQIAWLDSTGDVTGPHVHYMVWDDPAIFTWGNFADCAPNCCSSPLHNPANFLGPCD